jgi:hypothetical protein
VKRDGRKDKSSDLNSVNKKLINVLSASATNGKEKEKSSVDPPSAKSEQKGVKRSKTREEHCCPKLMQSQVIHLVYQIGRRRSYKSLVLKS